jgi:NSS family neurotransmitter:Na+ symporter
LSYYCVIAGWTLIYSTLGVTGNVANDAQSAAEFWQSLMASPRKLFIGHSIFIILVATVSAFGLKRGLEKCTKIAMPLFLATLLSLVGYGAIFGDFSAGFRFLFEPRFDEISIQVFVIAMGQALWSLGVGASVLMVYGAYLPPDINIRNSAIIIAIADAGVAILGGLAIFSLVFASGMNPADGPGLIFQTLPVALAEAPGGAIASTAFFVLLLVAGFTSAIGIMELVVAWAEEHMGTQRLRAVIYTTLFAWILGIVTVLSFNEWSGFYPLSFLTIFEQSTIFDVMDFTVASIVMPIAAVVVCIFAGWKVREDIVLDELGIGRVIWYRVWRILVRWVIPILLTILMVAMIAS